MKMLTKIKQRGFTLIELLIVIAIIAILMGTVLVAINPAKRIGESNNARRWSDVNSILSAVNLYVVDNKGPLPLCGGTTDIPTAYQEIGTCGTCCDLSELVAQGFLASMPREPRDGTTVNTGYEIQRDAATDAIWVHSIQSYDGLNIEVSR